ncbi:hypothetical protein GF407_13230 [candidate division KSB1 bacterium]|nr:hypothetical protein [candidate division KSB1 bacterium]
MTNKLTSINTDEALKIAMQCAMDMKNFYKKASELIEDNDDAYAILSGLSEKHADHKAKLFKGYSSALGKKLLYLKLGRKHKLKTLQTCGDDPNDAVRMAKKNETELKKYYVIVSRRVYEPEIRLLFRELATEIDQHLALLESSFAEPLTLDEESIAEERFEKEYSTN